MKRIKFFAPSILVCGFMLFLLTLLGESSGGLDDYMNAAVILLVFLVSDFLLSRKTWFGCIPGVLLGAYIVYNGFDYHGQVLNEVLIGLIVLAYYLILGVVTVHQHKKADS